MMAAHHTPPAYGQQPENSSCIPNFPAYQQFSDRCASAANNRWSNPSDKTNIYKWVENGYFYSGNGNLWICFQCGIHTKWSADTEPLLEHVKRSSRCDHLETTIHPWRLDLYKAMCSTSQCHSLAQNADASRTLDTNATASHENRCAVTDDLRRCVGLYNEEHPSAGDGDLCSVEDQEVEVSMNELLRENEILRTQCICHICESEDVNVVFLPCSHFIYCRDCASGFAVCPVCGRAITEKVDTYRK